MLASPNRFRGPKSLGFVFRRGTVVRGKFLMLRSVRNDRESQSRVAVVVSKKVAKKAHDRNRIRRRVFEAVRPVLGELKEANDMVFTVPNAEVAVVPFAELEQEVKKILERAKILT